MVFRGHEIIARCDGAPSSPFVFGPEPAMHGERVENCINIKVTSFLIRASTMVYRPLTPFGLPLIPLCGPLATTSLISFFFWEDRPLRMTFSICCAFSRSVISVVSLTPSAFFIAFSKRRAALIFFRALASAIFLIGRASRERCFARRASTASFVMGILGM